MILFFSTFFSILVYLLYIVFEHKEVINKVKLALFAHIIKFTAIDSER